MIQTALCKSMFLIKYLYTILQCFHVTPTSSYSVLVRLPCPWLWYVRVFSKGAITSVLSIHAIPWKWDQQLKLNYAAFPL